MASITETAQAFFDACETGKGWEVCKQYCAADASFAAQAEPVAEITSLAGYCDWMTGLLVILPDGRYEVKSFATDAARNTVLGYGVFKGTHTGAGGPPPAGKSCSADYVYAMQFTGGKISHMTKIWNAGWTMKELGWA